MKELPYSERLNMLGLYSVKGRLLRADLIKYWKIFQGACVILPDNMFTLAQYSGTRGHRYKIAQLRADMECRKRFFSMRRVAIWNSLPDNLVSCSSLNNFKSKLHNCLGDLLFEFDE